MDTATPGPDQENPQAQIEIEARLAQIRETAQPGTLTPALLSMLEHLALEDPAQVVRAAAYEALASPAAREVQRRGALPVTLRIDLLVQIDQWVLQGRLERERALVMRRRYDFDIRPAQLSPSSRMEVEAQVAKWVAQGLLSAEQAQALATRPNSPTARSAAEQAVTPPASGAPKILAPANAAPRQTFTQVVFSELSIRIALYLGGFLIVAAALILAAILEEARLPILLSLTAATGAAAGLLRKRLALPSFVLFIIFTCLLPIDARIWADMAQFAGPGLYTFWGLAWLIVALVLGGGTWLYQSRWLSLAALAAMILAAAIRVLPLDAAVHPLWWVRWTVFVPLVLLSALLSIGAARWLRRWQDAAFARPLFWAAQTLVWLSSLAGIILILAAELDPAVAAPAGWWWLGIGFALAFLLPVLSDAGYSISRRYPLQAAAVLFFLPFPLLNAAGIIDSTRAAVLACFGLALLAAGEQLGRVKSPLPPRYTTPLFTVGIALLGWNAWFTASNQGEWTRFVILLVAGLALSLLHGLRRRLWVWVCALLFGSAAFLVFFNLPFAAQWKIDFRFQVLALALLLLLPDLLRGPAREQAKSWTVAARWLGAIVFVPLTFLRLADGFVNVIAVNEAIQNSETLVLPTPWSLLALVMGGAALACLVYALRFNHPVLFILTAALNVWVLGFSLNQTGHENWSGWLAGLGIGYALTGYFIRFREHGKESRWSEILRAAGLAVAATPLFSLPFERGATAGFALIAAGGLFLVEMLAVRRRWPELMMELLLCIGTARLVDAWSRDVSPLGLALFLSAAILVGFDLLFTRWPRFDFTPLQRWIVRGVGLGLALVDTLYLVSDTNLAAWRVLLVFLGITAVGLVAAWGYRRAWVAVLPAGFLALSLFFALRAAEQQRWLLPLVGLAILYYLASIPLQRRPESSAWGHVLRLCGLGLALLVSLSAPLEGGLFSSLPVAAAATLYAVEAFRRRNAWLGFPANGLYLIAYFIILFELKVDQPQYYSVGVALLGLVQHYLLIRSGSRLGAFLTGMVSQLALLGTTYIQMVSNHELVYFAILFFQGLAVLSYGVYLRSRSLVIAPLVFIVIGVIAVVLSILSGVPTALIIGCTGVTLLLAGILAVLLRERLLSAGERLGEWRP